MLRYSGTVAMPSVEPFATLKATFGARYLYLNGVRNIVSLSSTNVKNPGANTTGHVITLSVLVFVSGIIIHLSTANHRPKLLLLTCLKGTDLRHLLVQWNASSAIPIYLCTPKHPPNKAPTSTMPLCAHSWTSM